MSSVLSGDGFPVRFSGPWQPSLRRMNRYQLRPLVHLAHETGHDVMTLCGFIPKKEGRYESEVGRMKSKYTALIKEARRLLDMSPQRSSLSPPVRLVLTGLLEIVEEQDCSGDRIETKYSEILNDEREILSICEPGEDCKTWVTGHRSAVDEIQPYVEPWSDHGALWFRVIVDGEIRLRVPGPLLIEYKQE